MPMTRTAFAVICAIALERAIEPAVDQEAVEKKSLRSRGNPEDQHQQADEEKNLEEADRQSRQSRAPGERNSEGVDRADREEDEGGDA